MGWVVFWLAVTAALGGLFVRWYFYARPHPRFDRTGDPADLQRSAGRFKTITTWSTHHTRKECPACGGWGDLLLQNGKLHKIPRHMWEHTRWVRRGMTMTCPACQGLGNVAANYRPPVGA